MREYRFFVTQDCIKGNTITLDGDEHNHLSRVLRLEVGDEVTIISNDNQIRDCCITDITKRNTILQIISTSIAPDNLPNVTLFQALVRADKMDIIAQKCTELGVKELIPFESQFCTVQDKGNKADRLNRIVLASCKQCGRMSTMSILPTISFDTLLTKLQEFHYIIFANEKECKAASSVLSQLKPDTKIAIIIGCEGGFSEDEANRLIANGAKSMSMGKLILRAETAAIALTSAVMYTIGEWER